ncbi:hypothetical protein PENTCL1PPCAC_12870, partial [Pristionchus entomophagus]
CVAICSTSAGLHSRMKNTFRAVGRVQEDYTVRSSSTTHSRRKGPSSEHGNGSLSREDTWKAS